MANLIPWLLSMVWPLAKKVLVSLGIGTLTYAGLSLLAGQVQSEMSNLWGQVPGTILQVLSLLGIPQSMGIIMGGISAKISFIAAGKLGKVTA